MSGQCPRAGRLLWVKGFQPLIRIEVGTSLITKTVVVVQKLPLFVKW